MKRKEADKLRAAGLALIVGGAAIASPADEVALAVATGGASVPMSLLQGPTTAVVGLLSVAAGAAVLLLAADK